jgi:hypothetical protein
MKVEKINILKGEHCKNFVQDFSKLIKFYYIPAEVRRTWKLRV